MTHFSDDCYTPTENDRLNAIFSELECCVEGLFDGEDLDLNSRDALLAIVRKRFSGAPVEPVPAPEITRLIHVIEEARAIAWDLYENPWDIPDAARDEISDLHNLLARSIQSAPVPAPRLDET